jgi:predicted HTH domain antitoxin
VFSILKTSPQDFANDMRLAAAVKWYERAMLSQSKAAELAGVSRQEFLAALRVRARITWQFAASYVEPVSRHEGGA